MPQTLSRRSLIKAGGSLWATAALSGQFAAIAKAAADNRAEQRLTTLTPDEAACAEAVAARILPTTDTPGAREAGALWFIDAALSGDSADDLPLIRVYRVVVHGIEEHDDLSGYLQRVRKIHSAAQHLGNRIGGRPSRGNRSTAGRSRSPVRRDPAAGCGTHNRD